MLLTYFRCRFHASRLNEECVAAHVGEVRLRDCCPSEKGLPDRLPRPGWDINYRTETSRPFPPHPIPCPTIHASLLAVTSSFYPSCRWNHKFINQVLLLLFMFFVDAFRCSMAAGDPTSALQWVGIALAVSTDSRQLGNEGRLLYLRGRCYQVSFFASIALPVSLRSVVRGGHM